MDKKKFKIIFDLLYNKYSNKINDSLFSFKNPFEILVFTILSARSKDNVVLSIASNLFRLYPDVYKLANANLNELEKIVYSSGFYHKKSKVLISLSTIIIKNFNGEVPSTMRELLTLPGVGRKTANIVLGYGFHKYVGIAVDTHVKRISMRLGVSKSKNTYAIEKNLMKIYSNIQWKYINQLFIFHGRNVCLSIKPKCFECELKDYCLYFRHINK